MEKVLEKDLVVGKDYWLDSSFDVSGIYMGKGKDGTGETIMFKRTSGKCYAENDLGYIDFAIDDAEVVEIGGVEFPISIDEYYER